MALTFGRWVLVAVVGCALAAAIVLHDDARPSSIGDAQLRDLERRADLTRRHLNEASERLRILRIRDSLAPSLAFSNPSGRVVVGATVPTELRSSINDLVATVDRERGVTPRYPGVIAFVADAVRPGYSFGFMVIDHLLPTAPGAPCVTLVRLNAESQSLRDVKIMMAQDASAFRLLGPCAFYEAFGPPGAGIAPWLEAGGWTLAQAGSWQREVVRWEPPGVDRMALLGSEDIRSLELRGALTTIGLRCISGDAASCHRALRDAERPSRLWGSVVSPRISQRLYNSYYFGARPLGPHEISYLGDMVHAIGAEKFARFWASPETPNAAFVSATGVELDDWTMQWMRRGYGDVHRGPGTTTSSVIASMLIAALAGLSATYAMTRRQVAA